MITYAFILIKHLQYNLIKIGSKGEYLLIWLYIRNLV